MVISDYADLVEQAYQDLFGRASDPGGLEAWTNHLGTGTFTPDQLREFMIASAAKNDLNYYKSHLDSRKEK